MKPLNMNLPSILDDIDVADDVADVVADADAEPTPPSPIHVTTPPPPQQELISSPPQVASTSPPSPHQYSIAQPVSPPQQQLSQPLHTTNISMDLLNTLLETYTTLTRKEIRTEEEVKSFWVKEIEEGGKIDDIDANEDVTLEEVDTGVTKDAKDDEAEPAELKEVIKVVTTAKLMTEVVIADATTITAAPSAAKRRKGVVIRDPKETATPSIIVHSKPKSKDKGKGIIVEEPKPLKKQAHIEQDKAHARELEAELNANINWNEVIEQVTRKKKQDNVVGNGYDKMGQNPSKTRQNRAQNGKRGKVNKKVKPDKIEAKETKKSKENKKED
nr:hypothetical protein [Tanacetum cinerariifolium]